MSTNGKTSDLNNFVASFAQDAASKVYRNGYAVFLYSQGANKKEGMKYAASVLDKLFMQEDSNYQSNTKAFYTSLKSLDSRLVGYKKSLKVNWSNNKIQNFLMQSFKAPVCRKKQPLPSTSSDVTIPEKQDGFFPQEAQLDRTPDFLPQVAQHVLEVPLSLKKLRTDCSKCNSIRQMYMAKCRILVNKLREVKANAKTVSRSVNKKVLNQTIKRKSQRLEKLKREKTALKTMVILLERQLRISTKNTEKCSLLSRRNRVLKKKNTKLQQEVLELKVAQKVTTEEK